MKLADLYPTAIFWSCYLENFPRPERYLNLYGLGLTERLMFDRLGRFSPFDEYYMREGTADSVRSLTDLGPSAKSWIVPWIYWPTGSCDRIAGKTILAPSLALFERLDDKIETKRLFHQLELPTPRWGHNPAPPPLVEKPIRDSAGGLGIRLTDSPPRAGCFLEEYLPGFRSIGIQYFVYDEPDFICADEMLFGDEPSQTFTFHAQKNVSRDELPEPLLRDCDTLVTHLAGEGYRGFIGLDVLIRDDQYYFLEINPRGIAFLPAFFAASALGWSRFQTYTHPPMPGHDTVILLDLGAQHKVVERLP